MIPAGERGARNALGVAVGYTTTQRTGRTCKCAYYAGDAGGYRKTAWWRRGGPLFQMSFGVVVGLAVSVAGLWFLADRLYREKVLS